MKSNEPSLQSLICFALLLSIALLCITGCVRKKSDALPAFETARAKTTGDLTQNITATGTLNAVVSVDVGSQISGRILTLKADFNTPVKKGDVVAEIDPSTYQAAVDQAKGDLASAKAGLDLARLTVERERNLIANKAGPQSDLDKADAEFRQAQAQVAVKEALLASASANLNYCRIAAPVDGIVIARKVDVGQTVAAVMTTPVLFTIAQDITKMHIIANVSEADIGHVAQGQPVEFTVDAFPDDLFQGKVSQVRKAPATTENVVTYDTVIDVDNPDQKLFPGMTAEVSIRVAQRQGVVTIPNAALRFTPPEGTKFENAGGGAPKLARNQRVVYQPGTDPATLKAVVVKIGITDGMDSEVLEGLREGDPAVTASTAAVASKSSGGPMGGPPP